jgi:NTE family protein
VTVAFVLSGGASLGAVEVGMLMALRERGIAPDLIVGTSVGALNGGWLAGHPDAPLDELAEIWTKLRRQDVFPLAPVRGFLAFTGRRRSLVPSGHLRALIEHHLTFERLEDAPVPMHVSAVNVLTGEEVLFSRGRAADVIMASAAIPAVFDPVTLDGVPYIDGGVVDNTPISHAVALGADVVWVLCAGYPCAIDAPPPGALAMALHALSLLVHQQLADDVEHFEPVVELHVIPPLCPLRVSPTDFSHGAELISRAHDAALEWLASGPATQGQAQFLAPHEHSP